MEKKKQIMTEDEVREYFEQKGMTVESVYFIEFAHITFSPSVMAMLSTLVIAAQELGDQNPGITGIISGGFTLIITITKNPLKK